MKIKYTKEKFWSLYEELPKELQNAVFSKENGDSIYNICVENEILDELKNIVHYVGATLIGLLSPENFEEALRKELLIDYEKSKNISEEIKKNVFDKVKSSLNELYQHGEEIIPRRGITDEEEIRLRIREKLNKEYGREVDENKSFLEKNESIKTLKKDVYREPID